MTITHTDVAARVLAHLAQPAGVWAGKRDVVIENGNLVLYVYRPGGTGWERDRTLTTNPGYLHEWMRIGRDDVVTRTIDRWLTQ